MRYAGVLAGVLCLASGGTAWADAVVREGSGSTPAAIQAAVDQFRTDLGPNNGVVAGSQAGGRREINWDGGGPASPITIDPSPMTRFGARGATFVTSGTGFETSAASLSGTPVEFGDLNATYPTLFAPFSLPRLFTALNSNEMDVRFNVPGNTAIPAGVIGFGAVFTDVDSATSTRLQFFAPDGTLLFERAVPAAQGNGTFSFLGVSFDRGEIVGRVRIVSGNAALGPDEAGPLDLVVMDDFIYGEPVSTEGLVISPDSGPVFRIGNFDVVITVDHVTAPAVDARVTFDGTEPSVGFPGCFNASALGRSRGIFSCDVPRRFLTDGDHVLQVTITFADQTVRRNAARWTVIGGK